MRGQFLVGETMVRCPSCGGTGKQKCLDSHCKGGILDLSGETVKLIIRFEREDGVILEGRNDSVLLP